MKGIHSITVQNKRIRYQFELKRNIRCDEKELGIETWLFVVSV